MSAPFHFNGSPIRTATLNAQPWLHAGDVCKALQLDSLSGSMHRISEADRASMPLQTGYTGSALIPEHRQATFISRDGFYTLVLQSNVQAALDLKQRAVREFLPAAHFEAEASAKGVKA